MPFAMIDTLRGSISMVQQAGAANGGIALDVWHIVKLKIPYDEGEHMPKENLVSVELNDGTFEAPWSLHEETINHRQVCGEGDFDINNFIRSVQKAGYTGPGESKYFHKTCELGRSKN
jgi:sugar phosphate isomerase/epimerase